MEKFRIYNEIQPTYGEWLPILAKLGYEKHTYETDSVLGSGKLKNYRFENIKFKSIILLPFKPDNAPVLKAHFAAYSYQLYMMGVIDDVQDMAKTIEKNRLTALTTLTQSVGKAVPQQ